MNPARVGARTATTVTIGGRELLAFAGCDYLGLACDGRLRSAAVEELARTGLSTGASRATTGHHVVHERLEEALAEFLGVESALVLADGYLADLALVQGLADRVDVLLLDADAHPSLDDAARWTGRERHDFGAGDLNRALALIDRHRSGGIAVLTDGVFPQQGRIAAANELLRMLPRSEAWLVVDDSHALGVLAATGRGTLELHGIEDPRVVVTFSMGKALGAGGGAIAGSHAVLARVRRRSDALIGSTALPPALAAAALAGLDVLQREPERLERLHANTAWLHRIGRGLGLEPRGSFLPVLQLPVRDAEEGERRARALADRGLLVPFVQYPGTPGEGVLRATVGSEHTAADLRRLEDALADLSWPA